MKPAASPQPRRAAAAAFIGTMIEWYDFYIYATAAALVFGALFFPSDNSLFSTMAAFGTFAVGFLPGLWAASSSVMWATASAARNPW